MEENIKMEDQNKDLELTLWYGSKDQDNISIQQWLDIVQKARGKYSQTSVQ